MDLRQATTPDLERLLELLEDEELSNPPSEMSLASVGLSQLADCGLSKATPEAVLAAVKAVLQERSAAPKTQLELVWSGPNHLHNQTRNTAVVVRELFRKAKESVLIGGCYFSNGQEIFKPLHAVMRDHGVKAKFCLDLSNWSPKSAALSPESMARQAARRFLKSHWPFGAPLPELYYDPRSFDKDSASLLHAKCVVIDGKTSLVTSANFTRSGQGNNLEVGVQIQEAAFSTRLQSQFLDLISSGLLVHCPIKCDELWDQDTVHEDSDWKEILEDMDEDFVELARALAKLGVRAPTDYGSDLAVGGRMSGCVSILDWDLGEDTLSLVDAVDKEMLTPSPSSWLFVNSDQDAKELASQINSNLSSLSA